MQALRRVNRGSKSPSNRKQKGISKSKTATKLLRQNESKAALRKI